ncbi:hypothetical protein P9314_18370, partial [Paenibacillus validus]|nr:hypothetical protein [Paenibacillus validus]
VNVPYVLKAAPGRWTLRLDAAGMQQVKLQSAKPLVIEGPDADVRHDAADGTYTVTHYGDPVELTITWSEP